MQAPTEELNAPKSLFSDLHYITSRVIIIQTVPTEWLYQVKSQLNGTLNKTTRGGHGSL